MTPFNMAFGMNAILPIEFLVPTLRVAKKLQWDGHELSQRLDKLQKSDKTERHREKKGKQAQIQREYSSRAKSKPYQWYNRSFQVSEFELQSR